MRNFRFHVPFVPSDRINIWAEKGQVVNSGERWLMAHAECANVVLDCCRIPSLW